MIARLVKKKQTKINRIQKKKDLANETAAAVWSGKFHVLLIEELWVIVERSFVRHLEKKEQRRISIEAQEGASATQYHASLFSKRLSENEWISSLALWDWQRSNSRTIYLDNNRGRIRCLVVARQSRWLYISRAQSSIRLFSTALNPLP